MSSSKEVFASGAVTTDRISAGHYRFQPTSSYYSYNIESEKCSFCLKSSPVLRTIGIGSCKECLIEMFEQSVETNEKDIERLENHLKQLEEELANFKIKTRNDKICLKNKRKFQKANVKKDRDLTKKKLASLLKVPRDDSVRDEMKLV